jgi:hypothetical protein
VPDPDPEPADIEFLSEEAFSNGLYYDAFESLEKAPFLCFFYPDVLLLLGLDF